MRHLICLLLLSPLLTHAATADRCAKHLGVPKRFAGLFTEYKLKHVIPLPFADFSGDELNGATLRLHQDESLDVIPSLARYAEALYYLDTLREPHHLHLQAVEMHRGHEPEVTYRMLFAHLLRKHPEVTEISFTLTPEMPGFTEFRAALAQGLSSTKAFRTTSIRRAIRAFGFRPVNVKMLKRVPRDGFNLEIVVRRRQADRSLRIERQPIDTPAAEDVPLKASNILK